MDLRTLEHTAPITITTSRGNFTDKAVFVRLYGGNIPRDGNFVVYYGLIEGKTPEEIRAKLMLTSVPEFMSVAQVNPENMTAGILSNNDGHQVRIFYSADMLNLKNEQKLLAGVPVHLTEQESMTNGLRLTLNYVTQGDELFVRIYNKGKQPMRGEWVYAYKHIAGKSDAEIAALFSFLNFDKIAACNVVVPEGCKIKGWSPPDIDEVYMYELDLNKPIEFIDDRLLLTAKNVH